eukprot:Skav231404  [mRNA]  locus=scaffold4039:17613:31298:- [translate_table: standard]
MDNQHDDLGIGLQLPVAFFWFALRAVFISNIGALEGKKWLWEAEKAQMLVPLLLWMEQLGGNGPGYTYCIIFPGIALTAFYFIDFSLKIWTALLSFSILFFLWQRYVMLWLYGKSQFDSETWREKEDTYFAFIVIWGVVLSKTAASFALWAYRLQEITEWPFALLSLASTARQATRVLACWLRWLFGKEGKSVDRKMGEGVDGDPGYDAIMEQSGISWWNVNPIYVLKQRLCPNEPGFEVHDARVMCWPMWSDQGFFEKGKDQGGLGSKTRSKTRNKTRSKPQFNLLGASKECFVFPVGPHGGNRVHYEPQRAFVLWGEDGESRRSRTREQLTQ